MDVPSHRPGFWDALDADLASVDGVEGRSVEDPAADVVATGIVPIEDVPGSARRTSPWIAASVAAALVLLVGVGTAFFLRPVEDPAALGSSTGAPAVGEGVESLSGTTAPAARNLTSAPWSAASLTLDEAPDVVVDAWRAAPNQGWCAALAPDSLDASLTGATPRAAGFGGGWAVSWDLSDGPGQNPDGTDCVNCGRSAFGVAGVGVPQRTEIGQRQEDRIEWADGSRADWGGEGFDPAAQKRVAEIVIPEQGCFYQVWSNLGDDHLLAFVDELRFVEGLDRGPVTLRRPGDPQDVVTMGDPPWVAEAVPRASVDPLVIEVWEDLDVEAPELVFASVGPELADATARTWGQGVAWDNPDGPGHTGSNEPCVDCGRGVVGIGWEPTVDASAIRVEPPIRIEWSDGSYAEYGSRLADNALPRDRIRFFDPETGEPTVDAVLATVHVAGLEGEVVVWTHLGEAHLLELIDQLRFAGP
jgi:hypothetical protein